MAGDAGVVARAHAVDAQVEVGGGARVIVGDEAAHPPQEPAKGDRDGHRVHVGPVGQLLPFEEPDRERHAHHEAAEAGQALPDLEELVGLGEVLLGSVHEAVADVAAHEGAQHQPEDQAIERLGVLPDPARTRHGDVAAQDEAEGHQDPEPVDLDGQGAEAGDVPEPEVEDDGVEGADQGLHRVSSLRAARVTPSHRDRLQAWVPSGGYVGRARRRGRPWRSSTSRTAR